MRGSMFEYVLESLPALLLIDVMLIYYDHKIDEILDSAVSFFARFCKSMDFLGEFLRRRYGRGFRIDVCYFIKSFCFDFLYPGFI